MIDNNKFVSSLANFDAYITPLQIRGCGIDEDEYAKASNYLAHMASAIRKDLPPGKRLSSIPGIADTVEYQRYEAANTRLRNLYLDC
jgi:hypothetical protein